MKLAIISDIHGNFDAFQKVLEDIKTARINQVVCLGDCIGYGAEPEAVVSEVRRRQIPTILGNHELAACNSRQLDWFNPMARSSIIKTLTMLSPDSMNFIRKLPNSSVTNECRCVHGYPPDSVRTYLFQKKPYQLLKTFKSMKERICFVGHTHNLEIIQFDGRQVERRHVGEGPIPLNPDRKYIVNVGSVGQPRDGNNNAKYVIYDPQNNQIEVRFIAYDIASAVAKIKAAGLPQAHANRLW